METKICNKCGQEKPLSDFQFRKDIGAYRHACKECLNKQKRELYDKNHEEIRLKKRLEKMIVPTTIICNKCHIEKDVSMFEFRNDTKKYRNTCKDCMKQGYKDYYSSHKEERHIYNVEYGKKYRAENKDKLSQVGKEYYEKNKDKMKERHKRNNRKRYLEKRDEILQYSKEYKRTHKEQTRIRIHEYEKTRKEKDPLFKLTKQVRTIINASFSSKGYKKNTKTEKILGCDIKFFINYLLNTYKNNYGEDWDGKEEVHIDHVIPLATANSEQDILKLCHYSNLQLLKAKDNLEKHDKLDWNK